MSLQAQRVRALYWARRSQSQCVRCAVPVATGARCPTHAVYASDSSRWVRQGRKPVPHVSAWRRSHRQRVTFGG